MIADQVRRLIENLSYVFVATSDQSGQPHMAIGGQITIQGSSLLIFENWFCPSTLENISVNSHISVVAVRPETGKGYQLLGSIVTRTHESIPDVFEPAVHIPEAPRVLTRFTVKVEKVLEFTSGIHSDLPIGH